MLPGRSCELGLEAAACEGGLSEAKGALSLVFRYHMPEPFFDKRFQRCLLTLGQLSGLFKKTIWNMYGCLHMA